MKKPRRPRPPRAKKNKQATPEQIRAYVEELYAFRQAEWHLQLTQDKSPDWSVLLGLHLQMTEIEQLEAGVKELL